MQLGRVLGTATTTVKHPSFRGSGCSSSSSKGRTAGRTASRSWSFDRLGAGRGDAVLVTSDGKILQEQVGKDTPGRWSVMGLPDR